MKKFIALFLSALMLGSVLVGCAQQKKEVIPCSQLMQELLGEEERPASQTLEGEELSSLYGMEADWMEEGQALVPLMNVKANEIALVRAKEGSEQQVQDALAQRKEAVVQAFERYLPDQLALAQEGKVGQVDGYCYLIIDEKAAQMEQQLKEKLS